MNKFIMEFKNGTKISFKDERDLKTLRSDLFDDGEDHFILGTRIINRRSVKLIKEDTRWK